MTTPRRAVTRNGLLVPAVSFDNYETPWHVVRFAERLFGVKFTLDPCCDGRDNAKARRFFTPTDDGLAQDWGKAVVFMNPPYGRALKSWVEKARSAAARGAHVVALIPPAVGTKWWDEHVVCAAGRVVFVTGRIAFWLNGAPTGKKWVDSCLVEWKPKSRVTYGLVTEWTRIPSERTSK